MLFQSSIGLDVRADSFSLVALTAGLKQIRLAAHTSFPLDSTSAVADRIKVIAEVAGDFIKTHGLSMADIYVGIARDKAVIRELQLPLSVKENLRATLGYELQKYIPLPSDQVYFDYQLIEENRPENILRLLLIVVRKADVDIYMNLSTLLGRQLSGLEIRSTALSAVLPGQPKSADNTIRGLILSASGGVEICIYRNAALEYTHPVVCAQTSDTAQALAGALAVARNLPQIRNQAQNHTIKWFFCRLAGGEAFQGAIAEAVGRETTVLDGSVPGLPSGDLLPAYSLALKGLRNGGQRANLLPPAWRKKPSRVGLYAMFALILLASVAMLAWGGSLVARHRIAVNRMDAQISTLQGEAREVEELMRQSELLQQQISQIGELRGRRVSALLVLQTLSTRIPPSAWIQELSFKQNGIQIVGFADSAREIVEILEEDPLFDNVVFLSAITKNKDGKDQFRIGMGMK